MNNMEYEVSYDNVMRKFKHGVKTQHESRRFSDQEIAQRYVRSLNPEKYLNIKVQTMFS